jgi:hypothetical protein
MARQQGKAKKGRMQTPSRKTSCNRILERFILAG